MKYMCLKCETEFEATQSVICPNCGASGMHEIETLAKYKRRHVN
jgi:rRNA maturation endonuclease Nob1